MQWWCAATGVPWTWRWQAYPGVWIFALALAGAYRLLRKRFPEADRPTFRAWMYGLGVGALWVALDWPVGALGAGYMASAHMVQFLLIALVAPPLLLLGLPRGLFSALGRSRLLPPVRFLTHPITAVLIFVSLMAWTHWPPVVDTLMVSQLGSFFLDLVWLVSGLVFWWPVVAPVPERSWMGDPAKVGYLIVATLVNTGVFAYLTFSPLPLYATYELAPPVTGLSTRDDQLLAGLLMKMGGAVVFWTAITIIFFSWYRRSESRGGAGGGVAALLALALVAGCADAPAGEADAVREEAVWEEAGPLLISTAVVGAPPVPDRAALYLRIRNPGSEPVTLAAVEVEGAAHAHFHETSMDGGVMRMNALESLEIPAGGERRLAPGGLHVMLMDVGRGMTPGDTVEVRLHLAGTDAPLVLPARVVPLEELEELFGG